MNIENLSIKKPPVYTLTECLNYYTKDKLFDLAKEHKDYVSKSKKKAEMIELLEEILVNNIENDSIHITESEKQIMTKVITREDISEINIDKTIRIKDLGYIYWFYHDNELQIVCPDEIARKYKVKYEDANKVETKETIKMNDDILNYTRALQQIYGVFEIEQLVVVWNKHKSEKLDLELAYKIMDNIGNTQDYFWWDSPYIVSNYFMDKKEYEEFLNTRVEKNYYIPTSREIQYYMEEEFDVDNLHYEKMLNYFKKQESLTQSKLNDLMLSIQMASILNNSFQDIINGINDSGFKFKDLNELNKFIRNYIDLSNNTRKWYLRGYKPVEVSEVNPKNNKNNLIKLKENKTTKKKKIARNEPCPCGSGKKFKFCCRS